MATPVTANTDKPTPIPGAKAPADKVRYEFDLTGFLTDVSDTLSAVAPTFSVVPNDMTLSGKAIAPGDLIASVWAAGGVAGKKYTITYTANTNAGRVVERSIVVRVAER